MLALLPALPYAAAALAAVWAYNVLVENPRIAREARQGYVTEATLAAERAKLAEVERQRDAARRATKTFELLLMEYRRAEDERVASLEAQINEYEANNVGRCELGIGDLEFLRR